MITGFNALYTTGIIAFTPKVPRTGKYPVLLLHGMGGNARSFNNDTSRASAFFARRLALEGFPILSASYGDRFGNAANSADVEVGRGLCSTYFPGCDNSKVVMIGVSMGGFNSWAYYRDYPTRVAGICSIMSGNNIEAARAADNPAGVRAGVDAAWGVVYPAALPAAAIPINTPNMSAVPSQFFYSTGDTVAPAQSVLDMAAVSGGPAYVAGNQPHGDLIMNDVNTQIDKVIAFLLRCGA